MKTSPLQQLSVVIPMYNEADNAVPLITEIADALRSKSHPQFEIIGVEDGSTDETLEKLKELQQSIPQLRVIRHLQNSGQSVAVITAIRAATYPWVVTLDGDGQNDPNDIIKLAKAADEQNSDNKLLVAGHRVKRKDSDWKRFGSRFANSIRRYCLRDDCPDSGCGLKLFAKQTFLQLPHFNHLHRYLPALFLRAGGRIVNVPVNHRPRTHGQSKYGNWGRLKVGISDLMGVAWLIRRPVFVEIEEIKANKYNHENDNINEAKQPQQPNQSSFKRKTEAEDAKTTS